MCVTVALERIGLLSRTTVCVCMRDAISIAMMHRFCAVLHTHAYPDQHLDACFARFSYPNERILPYRIAAYAPLLAYPSRVKHVHIRTTSTILDFLEGKERRSRCVSIDCIHSKETSSMAGSGVREECGIHRTKHMSSARVAVCCW